MELTPTFLAFCQLSFSQQGAGRKEEKFKKRGKEELQLAEGINTWEEEGQVVISQIWAAATFWNLNGN